MSSVVHSNINSSPNMKNKSALKTNHSNFYNEAANANSHANQANSHVSNYISHERPHTPRKNDNQQQISDQPQIPNQIFLPANLNQDQNVQNQTVDPVSRDPVSRDPVSRDPVSREQNNRDQVSHNQAPQQRHVSFNIKKPKTKPKSKSEQEGNKNEMTEKDFERIEERLNLDKEIKETISNMKNNPEKFDTEDVAGGNLDFAQITEQLRIKDDTECEARIFLLNQAEDGLTKLRATIKETNNQIKELMKKKKDHTDQLIKYLKDTNRESFTFRKTSVSIEKKQKQAPLTPEYVVKCVGDEINNNNTADNLLNAVERSVNDRGIVVDTLKVTNTSKTKKALRV